MRLSGYRNTGIPEEEGVRTPERFLKHPEECGEKDGNVLIKRMKTSPLKDENVLEKYPR